MKKVGVVLLSILFVFVAFATIFAINVNQTLLKPSFYKNILNENNAYKRFLGTDTNFFASLFESAEGEEAQGFDKVNLANVIGSIDPETLKKVVESGIDVALLEFNDNNSTDLLIDLTGIKSSLVESGDEVSIAFSETIPDSYSMFQEDAMSKNIGKISTKIVIVVLVVSLLILLVFIWLLSESRRSRLKTLGILLFLISLPILAVAIFGLYLIPINFSTYPEISELVLDLIGSLRDGFLFLFLAEALVIGTVALILYVFAVMVFEKDKKVLTEGVNEKDLPASK